MNRVESREKKFKLLDKIFTDTSSSERFYLGPEKLYQILKSKGVENVGKHIIRRWLQRQDWYSVHKPARSTFMRAKVRVSSIDNQYDADLADMTSLSRNNNGVKYLLVIIDIFSRYLWVEPLKNKTGKEVIKGFNNVFAQGRKCAKLRTDKGSEFTNKAVQDYLKSQKVYYFTTQNSDTKANYAERVIQTLKNMIYRYFTKSKTNQYINNLQTLVDSYNSTPHRSLGNIAPKDVNKTNQADIWAHQYLEPLKYKKVKQTSFFFKVGDLVRISHNNVTFKRSFNEQYSREIFQINDRFRMQGIPMYKIKDFLNEPIKGNFYASELQKVEKGVDTLWAIEKKIRKRTRNGKIEYLVKFDGWSDKYNQWIPAEEIKNV
ncbi:hypothetical protein FSP39_002935 [Pinctada imbricata]|uniref:Uncharacterized protein n=1 Tax=Pinctada imbricata TaxID=66713 RepID=A0AA88XV67_PINIB|nr:hypothetical protein FSP39_002935 [Pinctada imbricata]